MHTTQKIHWDDHSRQKVAEKLKINTYNNSSHCPVYITTIEMNYDDVCFMEIFQQQRDLFDLYDLGDPNQDLYKSIPASVYKQQLTTEEYVLHGVFIRSIERYPDQNRYIVKLSIDVVEVV